MDAKTRDMLHKLHNLYNKPGTEGEKAAAKAAIDRINQRLPPKERWETEKPEKEMSIDDILRELDLNDSGSTLSDGSSIFKTKDEMKKRWAKMANDSKIKSRKSK